MKYIFFYLLGALLLTVAACDKDDDCNAENLQNVIVGNWKVSSPPIPLGEIEFRANGTLVDDAGALVPNNIGGLNFDQKTYEVQSNTVLIVRGHEGSNVQETTVSVTSFSCNEIKVVYLGTNLTLKRD